MLNVGFYPFIPHSPTIRCRLYPNEKFRCFVSIVSVSNKETAVLSCDISIYLIYGNIKLSIDKFYDMAIRIGSVHLQKMPCSGQFIEGCGLDRILIEADIYGENTLTSNL